MTPEHATRTPLGWSRRDKLRLARLAALLVLVLVAMWWSSFPEHWHWIAPPADPNATAEGKAPRALEPEPAVRPAPQQAERAPESNESTADADATAESTRDAAGAPNSAGKSAAADDASTIDVDPEFLDVVLDHTLGVRHAEAEAFYSLLDRIRSIPPGQLERAARNDVTLAALTADPAHYRGRLLTVTGEVRRLVPLAADEEAPNAGPLYEAWLFTADSGNNPLRIVCTSIPQELPTGQSVRERVRVTGYFFKIQGYQTQSGLHTAPLILAHQLRRLPAPSPIAVKPGTSLNVLLTAGLVVVALGLGLMRWRTRYGGGVPQPARSRWRESLPQKIEVPEVVPPEDAFAGGSAGSADSAAAGRTDAGSDSANVERPASDPPGAGSHS